MRFIAIHFPLPTYRQLRDFIAPLILPDMPVLVANPAVYNVNTQIFLQPLSFPLSGHVHLESLGAVPFVSDQFIGARGQGLRLEGFQLQFDPPVAGLSLQYMAHLQDIGDVPWVDAGQFIGTRGQSLRLESFAIRLIFV